MANMTYNEPGDEFKSLQEKNINAGGISNAVIRLGFAKNQHEVNAFLIFITILLLGGTLYVLWPSGRGAGVDTSGVDDPGAAVY